MITARFTRISILAIAFVAMAVLVLGRLVYLQIIQHDYFSVLAAQTHSRKFEIAPQRGQIYVHDRGELVPIAMNRNLKLLYADTRYIYDTEAVVEGLKQVLGEDYSDKLASVDGYVVLEDEVDYNTAQEILSLEVSGIGLSDQYRRVYPEGSLAAQVLGFVNHDGQGQYGIEGWFDKLLKGTPGMYDIETDANGVPIATSDNIQIEPQHGDDIVLTIDRNIQAKVESVLRSSVDSMRARSAHVVVMDPNSGRILAMANYPTYDPNNYTEVEDYHRFINVTSSDLFEPGSGFKVFTMAAGLEAGVVDKDETFDDSSGLVRVADAVIRNVGIPHSSSRSMTEVITNSVNTGAVYVLKKFGGGEINLEARRGLYNYFANRFRLTEATGIEQPAEPNMSMVDPDSVGPVNYANITFGQGIATTMVRMVASMAGIINGGDIYKPYLVDYRLGNNGEVVATEPEVMAENIVSQETSETIKAMMATVVTDGGGYTINWALPNHTVAGKTGTAEIPSADGGYLSGQYIGSFIGFAPVEEPKYMM
ncbi:MAG: penicillin-binding protein 2, partial [Candidatus Saccharimonadales bacterium]